MENQKNQANPSRRSREVMTDSRFRMMTFFMQLMDIFAGHAKNEFTKLGLKAGQVVIDYGCGPARYVPFASRAVGNAGKVIAVDIHPLAVAKVKEKIERYGLTNVEAVLANGYSAPIPDHTADMVYALDMFHMIEDPNSFLKELHRLVKKDGLLIIGDGHQPREQSLCKINASGFWKVEESCKTFMKCRPV